MHIDKNVMYSRIKELTRGPRIKIGTVIKKSDGEIAVGIEEVEKI